MKQVFLADTGAGVPAVGTQIGNPQPGIPGTQPATKIGPHWFYMVTKELLNVLSLGAVVPDAAVYNQVATAIAAYVAGQLSTIHGSGTRTTNAGSWTDIDGNITKWGVLAVSTGADTITFPVPFPTACTGVTVTEETVGLVAGTNVNTSTPTTATVDIYTQTAGRQIRWRATGF